MSTCHALESRRLLSVSAYLEGRTLHVVADGTDNFILLGHEGFTDFETGQAYVTVDGDRWFGQFRVITVDRATGTRLTVGAFDPRAFSGIRVEAQQGDDEIAVNGSFPLWFGPIVNGQRASARQTTLLLDATVLAGDGNDTIVTLGGDDEVHGEAGNDRIRTFGGSDTIFGGDGNDRIDAGAGVDALSGGAGRDTLIGGRGRDRFDGGSGTDVIYLVGREDRKPKADPRDRILNGGGLDPIF